MMVSLDGYVAGPGGEIVGRIDEEVHAFANREALKTGTELYGRRMYETMVAWETLGSDPDSHPYEREFAHIWRAADKIVFSQTLKDAASRRTRLERNVNLDAIRALTQATGKSGKNVSVSGPTLAARFIEEGMVDEYSLYLVPVVVGGGIPFFKGVRRHLDLDLIEHHRFHNGVVFLRYRPR
jgi:dihydrofolate reductase